MKKIMIIVAAVLIAVIALGVTKDTIIKVSVEKAAQVVTGLKLSIRSLNVGIIRTIIAVRSLKLYNPAGYKDRVMLVILEIYVDYDLPAIIRGNVHLK